MTRRIAAFVGAGVVVLGVVAYSAASPSQAALSPRRQVQALLDAGRLDDAERTARGGGAALGASLGEVLMYRGRLAQAESAFRATIAAGSPERRIAQAGLAELAARRGDADSAFRVADDIAAAFERTSAPWPSDDRTAAARAYLLLGSDTRWVRAALAAFDAAVASDSTNVDAMVRIGDLFLDKYNAPDAREAYQVALRRVPNHSRALLGVARVLDFQDSSNVGAVVARALAANPSLTAGHLFVARAHLEAESYDSATTAARRALAVDSSSLSAWAMLGAAAWITGDSTAYRAARAGAGRVSARPADFYVELSQVAGRNRRYADAAQLAGQAVALDSTSVRALGELGSNLLRIGEMERGRAAFERAFALDPYNVWQKNTLDLLDELAKYTVVDRGRFRFVVPLGEADLLVLYLSPLLEEAYDSLAARYDYRPPTPIRLELFRRSADFSVRTVGLAGLGALGVSFGTTLAMDAPSARDRGHFNWGSTAWHELAHTFTLGRSAHRVPRWLSEGLSVFEERRARAGWGADATVEFLAAWKGGHVRKVSELSDGFVKPRYPAEVQFSYYAASLVCEMIFAERGAKAFVDLLEGYASGYDTPEVFRRALGTTMPALDERFEAWMRTRFAVPLRHIESGDGPGSPKGAFVDALVASAELIQAGRRDSALAALRRAQEMFPEYSGARGPAWMIAELLAERGDDRGAADQLARITTRNETAWAANEREVELRERAGDVPGTVAALKRLIWIHPYDPSLHTRLSELSARAGDHATAVRERRAVLALNPSDRLEARYQLARALADAGDTAAARREVLGILEMAPSFDKAQTLLLALRGRQ